MSNITKTAMITVCGRPNVGKSSLTNALVGEKVAIVSNKAQTTRNRIYGIVNRDDTQFILLDTPGLHKPKSALGDYMVKVVTSSLADVDCALLLVEPIPHVGGPEKALGDELACKRPTHPYERAADTHCRQNPKSLAGCAESPQIDYVHPRICGYGIYRPAKRTPSASLFAAAPMRSLKIT